MTVLKLFPKYCLEENLELIVFYNNARLLNGQKINKKPIKYHKLEATKAIISAFDGDTVKHRCK